MRARREVTPKRSTVCTGCGGELTNRRQQEDKHAVSGIIENAKQFEAQTNQNAPHFDLGRSVEERARHAL